MVYCRADPSAALLSFPMTVPAASTVPERTSTASRRRKLFACAVLAALTATAVFHASLLRMVAGVLVRDTAPAQPDAVVLTWGDGIYDAAARLAEDSRTPVFLKPEYPDSRLEQLGLSGRREDEFARELTRRGIPTTQQEVLTGPCRNDLEVARSIERWLARRPQASVALLCDAFQSRRWQGLLDSVQRPSSVSLGVYPLVDRRYDVSNWWKSRGGIRTVVLSAISLAVSRINGGATVESAEWDFEEYEQALLAKETPNWPADRARGGASRMSRLASWLDVGRAPGKVDYVVLLPGDENVRPFVAAAMLKAGLCEHVLLPKNMLSPDMLEGLSSPPDEVVRSVFRHRGVPTASLEVVEYVSDGTIDDARAAATVLTDQPEASVAIVTSFYHTRRARLAFEAVFGSRAASFQYISTPVTGISPDDWWLSEQGTQVILTEYVKLVAYWVLYGWGKWWLLLLVVAVATLVRRRQLRRRRRAASMADASGSRVDSLRRATPSAM
jgi:uncharacterized SAM-binding protein YcdF (DUF218 family)